MTSAADAAVEAEVPASASASRTRWAWPLARTALFTLFTLVLAFENPNRLARDVAGNPGDSFLIMSLLEWGADRATGWYRGYWVGPMFAGGRDVMAYTDTFLPLTVPFGLVEALTGSRVLAYNALYLASFVICAEATYRLGLRVAASRAAAVVGALAFTFSTIRIAQSGHFQLMWIGWTPIAFLLAADLRRRPSVGRGALLAVVLAVQFLTSAYYGLVMILGIGVFVGVSFLLAAREGRWRPSVLGHLAFFVVLAAIMLPVQARYQSAQEGSVSRGEYPAPFALRPADLRSPPPTATFLGDVPWLDHDVGSRTSENHAYPGLVAILLAPVGAVVWARRLRSRRKDAPAQPSPAADPDVAPGPSPPASGATELVTVLAVGLFGLTIAIGRGPFLGVEAPFYDVYAAVVPGLDSVVAIVRMFVFTQLALTLLAVAGFAAVVSKLPRPGRIAMAALALTVVAVEASVEHQMVTVVEPSAGSAHALMQSLDEGIAVELPMAPRAIGGDYIYLEGTRMVLGTDDALRTVNGYSGYSPADYETTIEVMNQFPGPAAMAEIDRLDVRYVVLHGAPVETGMDIVTFSVNRTGYAFLPPEEIARRLAAIPADRPHTIVRADDGSVIVDLGP